MRHTPTRAAIDRPKPAAGIGKQNPSHRRHTTIHEKQRTLDVRRIVRSQKQDRRGNLLRSAGARHHCPLCRLRVMRLHCLTRHRDALRLERREDRSRADLVPPYPLRRVVCLNPARQSRDRRLGGLIDRFPPPATTGRTEATLTIAPPTLAAATEPSPWHRTRNSSDSNSVFRSSSPHRPSRICGCRHCSPGYPAARRSARHLLVGPARMSDLNGPLPYAEIPGPAVSIPLVTRRSRPQLNF